MVAVMNAVSTPSALDHRHRGCEVGRGRSASSATSSARCGSSRGGARRLSTGPARPRPRRRLRRHAARRAGRPRYALPALLGDQAVRRRRALAADRAGSSGRSTTRSRRYWPAFAQQGKERVLVRHILSHRGGFPTTPPELAAGALGRLGGGDCAPSPPCRWITQPGTISAYHMLTQHWVCAELVRRLDGRSLRGLSARGDHRSARPGRYLRRPPDASSSTRVARLHATDGTDDWGRTSLPRHARACHCTGWWFPAASGVSTARDMARFYAAIAAGGALDGVRILRPETVERMLTVEVDGEIDRTFDVPVRRGLGFELGGLADPRRHWPGRRAPRAPSGTAGSAPPSAGATRSCS